MRSVLLASLRTHTRRYLAAVLAVTIGVSFIVVTAAISSAARDGMQSGVAVPFAGADVVADGLTGEEAAALVDGAPDAGAEAALLGWTIQPVHRDDQQLADDVDIAQITISPGLRWQVLEEGRFPTEPGEAAVDINLAKKENVVVGDRIQIGTGAQTRSLSVTALVDSPATIVYAQIYVPWADLATWADETYVDSVAWAGRGSLDQQTDAITAIAPDATVQSRDDFVAEAQVEANNGVDVMAMVLLLFAAIALFVSVLVIANTFSILFAQRQRDFALMRCVGATRRQVQRSIRAEALALGIGSSLVALAIGTGVGHGIVALVNSQWPEARLGDVEIAIGWYAAGLAIGTLVTSVRLLAAHPPGGHRQPAGGAATGHRRRPPHHRRAAGGSRRESRPSCSASSFSRLSVTATSAFVMVAGGGTTFAACSCSARCWCRP